MPISIFLSVLGVILIILSIISRKEKQKLSRVEMIGSGKGKEEEEEQEEEEKEDPNQELANNIICGGLAYVKDPRTGFCFAVFSNSIYPDEIRGYRIGGRKGNPYGTAQDRESQCI